MGQHRSEIAGSQPELSPKDSHRVVESLTLLRMATFSISHLTEAETPVDPQLEHQLHFRGFDHNDLLEGRMARSL
ncbi:YfbU family protein [Salinibacterium sp. SWN248]|nr:YfbU family protein [Salinibacterium sp. SWN248]